MKFTLITGASSGIGAMYARLSAQAGQNIILVSNQSQLLESVAGEIKADYGVEVRCIDIDLSAECAAQHIYDTAKQWGEVDCLISNAGVLHCGQFKNTPFGGCRAESCQKGKNYANFIYGHARICGSRP